MRTDKPEGQWFTASELNAIMETWGESRARKGATIRRLLTHGLIESQPLAKGSAWKRYRPKV